MFNDFLNRMVDSHFARFFPNAPAHLDPHDPEQAQLIEFWNDIRDQIRDNAAPRWDWSHPPSSTPAEPTAGATGRHHPGDRPEAGVHMDESQFKEAVHLWLDGTHVVGDSAEVLGYLAEAAGAGEESGVVILGEALGPIGMIASVVAALWLTVEAFGTGRRLQEQQGFCYGLMWQVAGHANADKHFIDWGTDSAEELKDAFYEGVAAGREKANVAATHNRIVLVTAYYQASGDDLATAQTRVLNDLWLRIRENNAGRDYLIWPVPEGMQAY